MSIEKIRDALSKLDKANDNQWTSEGLPRIDTIKFLMGGSNVTREDISQAAPSFTRDNPILVETEQTGDGVPAAGASTVTTDTTLQAAPAGGAAAPLLDTAPQGGSDGEVHSQAEEEQDFSSLAEKIDSSIPLEEQLAVAQNRLALFQQAKVRFDAEHAAAIAEHDAIADQIAEKSAGDSTTSAIREYLDGQNRDRQARAEKLNRLRELGLSAQLVKDALIPQGAPIDQKMGQRKREQYRP